MFKWILLILPFYVSGQCDQEIQRIHYPNSPIPYYDYQLGDCNPLDCDTVFVYRIDFHFFDIRDRIEIYIDGEYKMKTEWIGNLDFSDIPMDTIGGLTEGYVYYRYDERNDNNLRLLPVNFPNNHPFKNDHTEEGMGRFEIITKSKDVIFRVYPNESVRSDFKLYLYTISSNRNIRFQENVTCDTLEPITYEILPNCDTLATININVSDVGLENQVFLVEYVFGDVPENDTIWSFNEFGCEIPIVITEYRTADTTIYIPNTFSPRADNPENRVFKVIGQYDDIEMKIYDRWGTILFEGKEWNGYVNTQQIWLGVFVYVIRLKQGDNWKVFKGDITVFK